MDLIENQTTKHIRFTFSQITHQLQPSNFHSPSKSAYHQLSSSKDIFYETTPHEQRLAGWGYNKKLTYQQQGVNNKNIGKNRKRNIILFNPPYRKSLKTNIAKYFLDSSTNIFHGVTKFKKSLIKVSLVIKKNHKIQNIFNQNFFSN